ncbi:hypothetical protein DPMN_179504 [Dreissena polymorpha]|uniref:Uncharacterized protein n=1 Tax=Dreissena polymorpha TaxID=45954 RepID=A0A9D4EE44_DREPO|nr:hypothetical protein DPMN_179504 [Dreissena polymorpha]
MWLHDHEFITIGLHHYAVDSTTIKSSQLDLIAMLSPQMDFIIIQSSPQTDNAMQLSQ